MWLASVLAVAALGAPAPGSQTICTQIGCESGVSVDLRGVRSDLPRATRATVCLAARCIRVRELGTPMLRNAKLSGPGPVRVRVAIYDRAGHRLRRVERRVRLRRLQPNGPDCPPICWFRSLRLKAGGLVTVG